MFFHKQLLLTLGLGCALTTAMAAPQAAAKQEPDEEDAAQAAGKKKRKRGAKKKLTGDQRAKRSRAKLEEDLAAKQELKSESE